MPSKEGSASFLLNAIAHGKRHHRPQRWLLDLKALLAHRANKRTFRVDLQNPHKFGLVETDAEGCQDLFLPVFHAEQPLLTMHPLCLNGLREVPMRLDRVVFFVGSTPLPIQNQREKDEE